MRTRAEIVLKWVAAMAAAVTLGGLGLAATGSVAAGWVALATIYLTGVSYGLAEMVRLFQRHKRRCAECLEGAGPHLRWWGLRVVLVLFVSVLPVLLVLPLVSEIGG